VLCIQTNESAAKGSSELQRTWPQGSLLQTADSLVGIVSFFAISMSQNAHSSHSFYIQRHKAHVFHK